MLDATRGACRISSMARKLRARVRRTLRGGAALLVVAASAAAQEGAAAPPPAEAAPPPPANTTLVRPEHALELAVSDEAVWVSYRNRFALGDGFASLGFLAGDDDDLLLNGKVMRFGQPRGEVPLGLGVGIGFYAGFADEPHDDVYAVTLTGRAEYEFPTSIPTSLEAAVSFAPDATTFGDADELIDLLVRFEVDVSDYGKAFVGYRLLEADLDGERGYEFEEAVQVGVRLGW